MPPRSFCGPNKDSHPPKPQTHANFQPVLPKIGKSFAKLLTRYEGHGRFGIPWSDSDSVGCDLVEAP